MVLYDDGVNRVYVDAVRGLFERSRAKLSERFFGTAVPPEPYLRPLTDRELAAVVLANRAILLSDGGEALKNAKAAVTLFPKLPLAWVNLGFINSKSGGSEEAKHAYEHALEIDSANPYAINGLARLLLDGSVGGTPNPVEAIKLLERAQQAHGEVPAFIRSTYKDAQRMCGDIQDRSQK
jgi:Flp pilus assembly protein TadD